MFYPSATFAALWVETGSVSALSGAGVTNPTRAQAAALPTLLAAAAGVADSEGGRGGGVGRVYVLAAETRSGISLVNLLPPMQEIGRAHV